MTMLHVDEVTVEFGPTVALHRMSLHVPPGEMLAIVGPSGSGKSTLLHLMAGVVQPSAGEIVFRGEPITRWSDRRRSAWRLRTVGLVFQFGELVPELSLAENVRLPLQLAGTGPVKARKRAGEWLERFELTDVASKRPGQVSGGQLQRAAIARALVHEPAIVLADEPTGALDTVTGQLVLEALLDAARAQQSAVVLVTHEARLSSYCDREITLRDGAVAEPAVA
jgi:putative ABC transport system ATP-binding protein